MSILVNKDPFVTLKAMAISDVLVISDSSFSYAAALLNKHGECAFV